MRRVSHRRVALDFAFSLAFALAALIGAARADTISITWIGQKSATECGRAVLASLAARRGGDVESYYARLPQPPDPVHGYSIADMQRFGAGIGLDLALLAPAGVVIAGECSPRPAVASYFKRLAGMVATGRPIVVPVQSGPTTGHYLVLVGVAGSGFTVLDPASPGLRHITIADLAVLMCEFGYVGLVGH
jgi:hypothetical protein